MGIAGSDPFGAAQPSSSSSSSPASDALAAAVAASSAISSTMGGGATTVSATVAIAIVIPEDAPVETALAVIGFPPLTTPILQQPRAIETEWRGCW
jgi:hypothetical protein